MKTARVGPWLFNFLPPLLTLVLVVGQAACTKVESTVTKITAQEASTLVDQGSALLIDVREEGEVKNGMAAPALSMPLSHFEADDAVWKEFVGRLPKDKRLVAYCERGPRAEKVAKRLSELGFNAAYFRGYRDWKDAGLPTKQPATAAK